MSAADRVITLAAFLKLEAPSGDVNLCDGGFLYYDAGAGAESHAKGLPAPLPLSLFSLACAA